MDALKKAIAKITRFSFATDSIVASEKILETLPLAGLLLGAVYTLAAILMTKLLISHILVIVISAIAIPLFGWWANCFINISALIAHLENLFQNKAPQFQHPRTALYWQLSSIQGIVIIKIICVAVIVSNESFLWLLLPPLLALVVNLDIIRGEQSGTKTIQYYKHWLLLIMVALVVGLLYHKILVIGLLIIAVWFAKPAIRKYLQNVKIDNNPNKNLNAMIEFLEIITLLVGAIL